MTVESDVAAIYEWMLLKGASELTAREVAIALYWQLVPDSDETSMREWWREQWRRFGSGAARATEAKV